MTAIREIIDAAIDQLLSLFDLGNPFSVYFWVMVMGFTLRLVLVLWPLRAIYKRYSSPKERTLWGFKFRLWKKWNPLKKASSTLKKAKQVTEATSVKGIEQFLMTETVLALAPLLCAGILRLSLGSPTISEWTSIQMYVLFGVFTIWLAFDLRRSLEMRKSLKRLDRWYADPRLVNTALVGMTYTKRGLVRLAKLEIPSYREEEEMNLQQMRSKNDEGEKSIDGKAVIHNAKQLGTKIATKAINIGIATKSASKSLGERGSLKLDQVVQEKVEEVISLETGRIIHFFKYLLVVFAPLAVIYSLPYSFEQILDVLLWW